VEAQATASIGEPPAIISLTTETSTVIPRVLKEPLCELPHCLIQQVLDAELLAVAVGPQEVRVALVHRHDVLVVDEGHHPLLLPPDPGAVGVDVRRVPVVEELDPRGGGARPQGVHVVLDLEQIPAGRTSGR